MTQKTFFVCTLLDSQELQALNVAPLCFFFENIPLRVPKKLKKTLSAATWALSEQRKCIRQSGNKALDTQSCGTTLERSTKDWTHQLMEMRWFGFVEWGSSIPCWPSVRFIWMYFQMKKYFNCNCTTIYYDEGWYGIFLRKSQHGRVGPRRFLKRVFMTS